MAALDGAVKHLAVDQLAGVVDGDLIGGLRIGAGTLGHHLVGEAGCGGFHAFLFFDFCEEGFALGLVFLGRRFDGGTHLRKLGLIALERLGLFAHALDFDGLDAHVLDGSVGSNNLHAGYCINDFAALDDFAEHGVAVIEPRGGFVGNEKLASVGSGAGVGHGEYTGTGVAQAFVEFIREAVAGAAAAGSLRAAGLDHEILDHAVEQDAVVVWLALLVDRFASGLAVMPGALGQTDEIRRGQRGFLKLQLGHDGALGSVNLGVEAVLQFVFLCHYGKRCQRDGCGQSALQAVVYFFQQFHGTAEGTEKPAAPQ